MIRIFAFIILFFSCQLLFAQGKISRNNQNSVQKTSTKFSISGNVNGHDYVDLGLPSGKKWATCNVGASTPYREGDLFIWGNNEPQKKNLFPQAKVDQNFLREISGYSGNEKYDAATKIMGKAWRTPTIEELKELAQECKWHFVRASDFLGYRGVGPNGNSILLPCTSWYKYEDPSQYHLFKHSAQFWSSELDIPIGYSAYILRFVKEYGESPTVYNPVYVDHYLQEYVLIRLSIRAIVD